MNERWCVSVFRTRKETLLRVVLGFILSNNSTRQNEHKKNGPSNDNNHFNVFIHLHPHMSMS